MTTPPKSRVRILFGGSFDPPTAAHRRLIEIALAAHPSAELVVIPAGNAPHKRDRHRSSAEDRLAMARLAFRDLPRVRVSDEEIERGGTSWTVDTLERHRRELGPAAQLFFLMGADSLLSFGKWREPMRILELAKILAVARPGFDLATLRTIDELDDRAKSRLRAGILEGSGPEISSTALRARLRGESDDDSVPLHECIDPRVIDYVEEHRLYRDQD